MSVKLKPITMYECQHCKKLFRTSARHNCRRDPDKTNCYSCEHWKHQFSFNKNHYSDDELNYTCDPEDTCAKYETSFAEEAHGIMRESGWHLHCPEYQRKA